MILLLDKDHPEGNVRRMLATSSTLCVISSWSLLRLRSPLHRDSFPYWMPATFIASQQWRLCSLCCCGLRLLLSHPRSHLRPSVSSPGLISKHSARTFCARCWEMCATIVGRQTDLVLLTLVGMKVHGPSSVVFP